ncbi:hypothetical protein ACFFF5_11735 [Lederbergia wuyishanensis]|uniref:Uncharacterized protein n=1 Tax=Lederbergia wuyishanensis TaxID=1347903 RepID=A0ABU0D3K1_9BACI|nr:hypothetical protein [Lederbergia wuyishanensis]MCJ8007847.1 hypothetical protein [Lederbergia wuyishanensis]MDQ0342985.1 hypothetical protein [Lederbergia wuyishanensis]
MKILIWIIPNIMCYLMFIGLIIFIVKNEDGLLEINQLFIWLLISIILLLASIYGSYRIQRWIKEGKI